MSQRNFIVPLLHLLIGLVNKVWTSLCDVLDELVDTLSDIERKLRDENVTKQSVTNELTERIEIIKIHNMIISLELNKNNTDPKYTQESYNVGLMELKSLEMSLKENNQEINKLDKELQEYRKVNGGSSNQKPISYSLQCILDDCNIKQQKFHGGAMNGVCCR